jgi:elongation factor Ts
VPGEALEARRQELLADPAVQAKPADVRDRIVDGQLKKWFQQVVLYEQPFRDEERTVRELIVDRIATIGENIVVRRFARYALGEEL